MRSQPEVTLLTVEEVSSRTGLRPNTIRKQIATGKVDAIKVGTIWLLTPEQAAAVKRRRKRSDNG